MLWRSCIETVLLHSSCFYPGGERSRNQSEWSSKSRKTGPGWKSEGKEDEDQTKIVVWAQNEGRRISYYKGMG